MRIDENLFEDILSEEPTDSSVALALKLYEEEMLSPFPQSPHDQLEQVLNSLGG